MVVHNYSWEGTNRGGFLSKLGDCYVRFDWYLASEPFALRLFHVLVVAAEKHGMAGPHAVTKGWIAS
jgi:hypothetical protein